MKPLQQSLCLLPGIGGGVTTLAIILDTQVEAELTINPPYKTCMN